MKSRMKRIFSLLVVFCLLTTGLPNFAASASKTINIKVNPFVLKINGKTVNVDSISYLEKVFMQPQDISVLLGIEYSMDAKKAVIDITGKKATKYIGPAKRNFSSLKAQTSMKLTVNSTKMMVKVNGNKIKSEVIQYFNSYFVSAKEICDLLGKDYILDTKNSILSINEKKPPLPSIRPDKKMPTRENVLVTIDLWGNAVKKEYKIDNGKWINYTKPILMSVCGTVYARGTNVAGINSDISKTIIKNIDKVSPKLLIKPDPSSATNKNVTVSVDWDDAVTKKYKIDNGAWQNYTKPVVLSKNAVFYAQGTDAAGNVSVISKFNIHYIDKIPPKEPTLTVNNTMPTKEDVVVTINNPGDGQPEYQINDGEWTSCTISVAVKENGTFKCRTKDLAGNVSKTVSQVINNIDKLAPTKPTMASSNPNKTKSPINITIDNWGDAETKEYRIGDGAWQAYSTPITVSTNCNIFARGTDLLGNISEIANLNITNILTKQSVQEIAKKNAAIVLVKVYNANNRSMGTGSGFIITQDGKVVTNYHVVDKASFVEVVTSDNKTFKVSGLLDYNVAKDLAVLQLENAAGLTTIDIGNSDELALGEEIVAIGSPLGLQNTVSNGIVSSIRADINRKGYTDIQISAPISSGSSGGALFNLYGEVVGITYAGTSAGQNLNFAIPVNDAKPMIASTQMKSLANVKAEVYPTMSLKDFSEYLYDGYSIYETGSSKYMWDMFYTDDETKPGEYTTIIAVKDENYAYLLQAVKDGKKGEIENWISDIINEYRIQYSNKSGTIALVYFGVYKSYPSGFSSSDVKYNSETSAWTVLSPIVVTIYDSTSKNHQWEISN